jgi:hypothetical protein
MCVGNPDFGLHANQSVADGGVGGVSAVIDERRWLFYNV